MNILFDVVATDDERRHALYSGDLFVFGARESTLALIRFARHMIEETFDGMEPELAQYQMPVEEFVARFGPLKPRFIHHPETKGLIQNVLAEFACDPDQTYLDVPRLRAVTHGGYLTSGVGYAHHPHRDTWYSAPMCQLNWWLPIYPFTEESGMAFHPHWWDRPIKNGSTQFNYYEWNAEGRKNAAHHIKSDTRKQPKAEEEIEIEPQVRLVCNPGGVILFSAAHLHSTVPNTSGRTRFSIDFRTVHYKDVAAMSGAPNVDSASRGTSLRDFMRGTDLDRLPAQIVDQYDNVVEKSGALVFQPA